MENFKKIIGKTKQMCYHIREVIFMDEQKKDMPQEAVVSEDEIAAPEKTGYQPRPKWQVLVARIGLVIFILFVIMSYILVARGGL